MPKLPKHILVIRLSAMGDVAMAIPILNAFTRQYPDVRITVLTKAFFKPFFRSLNNVNVLSAQVKDKHKGVFGLYRLSKEIKGLNIDAVADLHNVLRSKILKILLTGYPFFQIDKGRKEKQDLISGKRFEPLKTTHQRYVEVFEKLGFKIDLNHLEFPEKAVLNSETETLLKTNLKSRIGIAPFAAHEGKMYPLNLMKDVIEVLSKEHQVILFGGGDREVALLSGITSSFKNAVSVAGKLSLDQELDVISNLDLMIAMDSGNGHIAASLGVKVLTIWGVTHPYSGFKPFNQPDNHDLLPDRAKFPKIPTSVYGNKYPESYKNAAGSITPNTIINKVKSII